MTHSEELEKIIIGSAILNQRVSVAARQLATTDFYFKRNRDVWSAIIEIDEDGEVISPFEIQKRCASDVKVSELMQWTHGIPPEPPRDSDIRRFREMSIARNLQRTFASFSEQLEQGNLRDVIAENESLLESLKRNVDSAESPVKSLGTVMVEDVYPRLDKFAAGEVVKLAFGQGFEKLDDATNGGVGMGELVLLGAKPKRGKSALTLQIAANHAKCGDTSMIVSREMLNFENGFRFLAQNSKYSNNVFRPDLMTQTAEALKVIGDGFKDLPLFLDDRSKKMSEIRRNAKTLKETSDLKSVFIDYAQLMRPDQKKNNRAEVLEQIYYDAKELAQDLEIAIYMLAQFNGEGIKSDRPTMVNFDGSSAASKAGNLILLWELEPEFNATYQAKKGKLWIEAGRNVAADEFDILFYGSHSRFELL